MQKQSPNKTCKRSKRLVQSIIHELILNIRFFRLKAHSQACTNPKGWEILYSIFYWCRFVEYVFKFLQNASWH